MVVLQPPFVSAKLFFQPVHRALERGVDLVGTSGRLCRHAGGEVNGRVRDEQVSVARKSHHGFHRAVEILADRLAEAILDVRPQGVADIELFSADLDPHALLRFP